METQYAVVMENSTSVRDLFFRVLFCSSFSKRVRPFFFPGKNVGTAGVRIKWGGVKKVQNPTCETDANNSPWLGLH